MSEKKGLFGGLFGGGKKSDCCNMQIIEDTEEENCGCGAGCDCGAAESAPIIEGAMSIKVLDPGCENCAILEQNTKLALAQLGIQANLEKVSDMDIIASYGIMSTPGLIIDEKIVSIGKVLKPGEIVELLQEQK